MEPTVTEETQPVIPREMANPNFFFLRTSSCRPMTKINHGTGCEVIPAEDVIHLDAPLPPSIHENEPDTILGPDHEPNPETEPVQESAPQPASGPEPVLVPEVELEQEPETETEPEMELEPEPEPETEPGIGIRPLCGKEKGANKP